MDECIKTGRNKTNKRKKLLILLYIDMYIWMNCALTLGTICDIIS